MKKNFSLVDEESREFSILLSGNLATLYRKKMVSNAKIFWLSSAKTGVFSVGVNGGRIVSTPKEYAYLKGQKLDMVLKTYSFSSASS